MIERARKLRGGVKKLLTKSASPATISMRRDLFYAISAMTKKYFTLESDYFLLLQKIGSS